MQVFVNLHTLLEPHHHQWQLQPLSTLTACFSECTGVNTTKQSWLQAELSPHRGDLGLRSLSHHSTAATFHLCATLNVPPQITHIWRHQLTVSISPSCMSSDTISIESCLLNKPSQHNLSDKLEAYSFSDLFDSMSCAHRARLLSVFSPHAAAWLTVTPSGPPPRSQ